MGFKLDGFLGIYGKKGAYAPTNEETIDPRTRRVNVKIGGRKEESETPKIVKTMADAGAHAGERTIRDLRGVLKTTASKVGTGAERVAAEVRPSRWSLFLTIMIFIHFLDASAGFESSPATRIGMYLLIFILGLAIFFQGDIRRRAGYAAIIAVIGYLWPFIGRLTTSRDIDVVIVFVPAHIILYYFLNEDRKKLADILFSGYIIFLIIIFLPKLTAIIAQGPIGTFSPDVDVVQGWNLGLRDAKNGLGKAWENILYFISGKAWAAYMNDTQRTFGPETVTEGKPRGIYLDTSRRDPTVPWIWTGNSKTLSVKLRIGEGTVNSAGIMVENKCRIVGEDDGEYIDWNDGSWRLASPQMDRASRITSISCTLYGKPSKDRIDVMFASKYEFETTTRLTTYFVKMDSEGRLVGYEKVPFFDVHGELDEFPAPKSDDAPFKMGIGTPEPPIGLDNTAEIPLEIDMERPVYENLIELEKLKSIQVTMPSALRIVKCNDNPNMFSRTESGGKAIYAATNLEDIQGDPYIYCTIQGNPDALITTSTYKAVTFTATATYDVRAEKTENVEVKDPSKSSVSGLGGGNINVDAIKSKTDVIDKLKVAASAHNVPADYAIAIAITESGLEHYSSKGIVKRGGSGEYGIMQIMPDTGAGNCPGYNLEDIDQNIDCGVIVMRGKCDGATAWGVDGPCDSETSGLTTECGTVLHGWDIMARLYNGGRVCNGYVESISAIRNKLSAEGLV